MLSNIPLDGALFGSVGCVINEQNSLSIYLKFSV